MQLRAGGVFLLAASVGCIPLSMLQDAPALAPGEYQVGVALQGGSAGRKLEGTFDARSGHIQESIAAALAVSIRRGLGEGHDIGLVLPFGVPPWLQNISSVQVGAYLDSKWSWSAGGQTHALAPGIGIYMNTVSVSSGHGETNANRLVYGQLPYLIGFPVGKANSLPIGLLLGLRLGGGLDFEHGRPFGTAGFGVGTPLQLTPSVKVIPSVDAVLAMHGNWAGTDTDPGGADGLFIGSGNFTWAFTFGVGLLFGGQ
jgi:hypothetical protein